MSGMLTQLSFQVFAFPTLVAHYGSALPATDSTFRSLVGLALCAAYRVDLYPSVPTKISLDTQLQWGPLLAPRHCKPLFFGY